MATESIEQIRQRLLRDENVRHMISVRAYEIYESRGGAPGHDVEDWFQAENEILAALIEQEMSRAAAQAHNQAPTAHSAPTTAEQPITEPVKKTKSRTTKKADQPHKQEKPPTQRTTTTKARRTKKQSPEVNTH
jgi:hypothetical protein